MSLISEARDLLSVYRQNEDLINVGAYVKNSNPKIDRAIDKFEHVESFLKQRYDTLSTRTDAFAQLGGIFK
jgi:flagellar biosynthesis/type III secretory pathway ATPase